jgi:hypothetical protein
LPINYLVNRTVEDGFGVAISLLIDHRLVERASSGEALVQSHRAALGIGERFVDPLGS